MRHVTLIIGLLLVAYVVSAQETDLLVIGDDPTIPDSWSIAVSGGGAIPITPDKFAHLYETGYAVGGSVSYYIIPSFSVGGFLEYSYFTHTGRPFQLRNQEMRCVYGGDKSSTSTGMVIKMGIVDLVGISMYATINFGVARVYRAEARYNVFGYGTTAPSTAIINEYGAGTLGFEYPIFENIFSGIEFGYELASDGVVPNQFLSGKATTRIKL